VSDGGAALGAVLEGLGFAVQFNPLVALVTVVVAAALSGYPRAPLERSRWAVLIVAIGWLIGDGLRVLGRARDVFDGVTSLAPGAPPWPAWLTLAIWAVGSLALGYALPALVGATVGRRVTHGTGWLAAAGVAAGLSFALSVLVGAVA
jgi:hypothetical protein